MEDMSSESSSRHALMRSEVAEGIHGAVLQDSPNGVLEYLRADPSSLNSKDEFVS
jgi:hypothetical protein